MFLAKIVSSKSTIHKIFNENLQFLIFYHELAYILFLFCTCSLADPLETLGQWRGDKLTCVTFIINLSFCFFLIFLTWRSLGTLRFCLLITRKIQMKFKMFKSNLSSKLENSSIGMNLKWLIFFYYWFGPTMVLAPVDHQHMISELFSKL